jgi:hypothetical protein
MPNTIYSAQRLQPYRGGHAVPMPNAGPGAANVQGVMSLGVTSNMPPDPRYGYTEEIAVPQTYNIAGPTVTGTPPPATYGPYGLANVGAGTNGGTNGPAATNFYYHTLGLPNDSPENWDYFAFNDRDFSSVAELLLVPGCPPGLFTKQFAEFAPSQMNAANIFSTVTPVVTPSFSTTTLFSSGTGAGSYALPNPAGVTPLSPFATATAPFLDVSDATATSTLGSTPPPPGAPLPPSVPAFSASTKPLGYPYSQPASPIGPIQPHAYPYLVDKFFYTGASTFFYPPVPNSVQDPGNNGTSADPVVGGPGGDGWFKMFEFFEVPSQMIGAIGPVAQGANFDWARQDSKPGLMNLNLIIDEEAFYVLRRLRQPERGQRLQSDAAQLDRAAAAGHAEQQQPARPAVHDAPEPKP